MSSNRNLIPSRWCQSLKQWFVASSNDCSQVWYDKLPLSLYIYTCCSYIQITIRITGSYPCNFLLCFQQPTNRSSQKSTRRPCLPWKKRTRPGSFVAIQVLWGHCMLGFRFCHYMWVSKPTLQKEALEIERVSDMIHTSIVLNVVNIIR